MTDESASQRQKILEILDAFRQRTNMYIDPVTPDEADKFLYGFDVGCLSCGVHIPWQNVADAHGWLMGSQSPIHAMRQHGMTDNEIIDELITLRVEVLQNAATTAN